MPRLRELDNKILEKSEGVGRAERIPENSNIRGFKNN